MKKYLEQLGRLFIIGYKEEAPPLYFLNFLHEENIGGVILFQNNCPSHEFAQEAIDKVKRCYKNDSPFIAVDQEGGRVSRVQGVPAQIDDASKYGAIHGLEKFEEDYHRSLILLESLGFNINLAPVCDLFVNTQNECLKDRCFGNTPEQVIPFIETAIRVSEKVGMLSCLKHFPGLGHSGIDPHKKMAIAYYNIEEWLKQEFRTFAAGINQGADMVMSTHITLPKIDAEITTTSSNIINNLLRQELAFSGVLITDDLIMDGIKNSGDIGERTIKAFNAGHDILLFSQDSDLAMEAFESFRQAYEHGEIPEERVRTALERISNLKFKLTGSFSL